MAESLRDALIGVVTVLSGNGMTVDRACALVGVSRSTFYRITGGYQHYRPVTTPIPQAHRRQPSALTTAERAAIIDILGNEDYSNLSVGQTYWRAFDAELIDCSERTFYRVAAASRLTGDRRRRRHADGAAPRRKPVVAARAPGDLWSWDITALRGPGRDMWFKLYLAIDVYSRYPVAWRIEHHEDKRLAAQMFKTAFDTHGPPKVLHSDNGGPMKSAMLRKVLSDKVLASYSRPRVSDDNPFSESMFKTTKYDLSCPEYFTGLAHARTWSADFFDRYAKEHLHSGIGWHTPASMFDGTAIEHQARRQRRLDGICRKYPQRFATPPAAPKIPTIVGININKLQQTPLSQPG